VLPTFAVNLLKFLAIIILIFCASKLGEGCYWPGGAGGGGKESYISFRV
jgi:hypothetical protein